MKQLEEQRVCVKFCFKLWKTFVNCWSKLTRRNAWVICNATIGLSVSKRVEHQWVKISGLDDLPHQQTTVMSRVCEVIRGNRRLRVREVAEDMGISVESYHAILTRKHQMHCLSAKFIRLLTDGQNENWVSINQYMLANADIDIIFLENRLGSNWLVSIPHMENHFERT